MLSKDQIAVDIISFGEMEQNHNMLEEFISKVNIDNNRLPICQFVNSMLISSHLYEVSSYQNFRDFIMANSGMNSTNSIVKNDL